MAGNDRPPLKRQVIRRVPPNIPRDVQAQSRPVEYDPAAWYGYGAPRSVVAQPHGVSQMQFPPWIYPPLTGAQTFTLSVNQTLPIGPSTTELLGPLGTSLFQLPANNVGVIRSFALNVNNLLASSDITFTLLFNQAAVEGQSILIQPRAAASVSEAFGPEETMIFVPLGARISWRVQVVDLVAYQVGVTYRGWWFSKDLYNQYSGV